MVRMMSGGLSSQEPVDVPRLGFDVVAPGVFGPRGSGQEREHAPASCRSADVVADVFAGR